MTGPQRAAASHRGEGVCWPVEFQDFKEMHQALSVLSLSLSLSDNMASPDNSFSTAE